MTPIYIYVRNKTGQVIKAIYSSNAERAVPLAPRTPIGVFCSGTSGTCRFSNTFSFCQHSGTSGTCRFDNTFSFFMFSHYQESLC